MSPNISDLVWSSLDLEGNLLSLSNLKTFANLKLSSSPIILFSLWNSIPRLNASPPSTCVFVEILFKLNTLSKFRSRSFDDKSVFPLGLYLKDKIGFK